MYMIQNSQYMGKTIETIDEALRIATEKAQQSPGVTFFIFKADQAIKTGDLPVDSQKVELIEGETFAAKYLSSGNDHPLQLMFAESEDW